LFIINAVIDFQGQRIQPHPLAVRIVVQEHAVSKPLAARVLKEQAPDSA